MCTLALVVRQVGWDIDKFDAVCADRYPWERLEGKWWGLAKDKDSKVSKYWQNSCNRNHNWYGDGCGKKKTKLWGRPCTFQCVNARLFCRVECTSRGPACTRRTFL